jgi:hypothetical protein
MLSQLRAAFTIHRVCPGKRGSGEPPKVLDMNCEFWLRENFMPMKIVHAKPNLLNVVEMYYEDYPPICEMELLQYRM